MATLPQPIKARKPQNARLGIKSSLSNIKRVVSLLYLLYVANDRKGKIEYAEEYFEGGITKIRLKKEFQIKISTLFAAGEVDGIISKNPLLTSQLEHLQVGLELVFQLGKIYFVSHKASSAERTGGNRFAKAISFSKNIIYLDVYFSALSESLRNKVLSSWMKNETSGTDSDDSIYTLLTSFTEYLKMSVDDGSGNCTFEQEGLYSKLIAGKTIVGKDIHEDVGPLRIYKSFVKENMHSYVTLSDNEFLPKVDLEKLNNYLSLVSTDLDLRNSEIPEVIENIDSTAGTKKTESCIQLIYYGCPGTGKSRKVKELTGGLDDEKLVWFDKNGARINDINSIDDRTECTTNIFRTTFHPDYDYSSFVGSYKPVMKPVLDDEEKETGKEELVYEFVPQVFINAYVRAYKSLKDETLNEADRQVYLIIEEINRGNCAQIFGDLFQLLDRKNGESEFPIIPDAEIRKHLKKEGLMSNNLILPPNLHIYATMNTSDQSLFPMDSAFKRRWAMEYVPIDLENKKAITFRFTVKDKQYSWVEFLGKVNPLIRSATESEDKQMGEFFIKGENIPQEDFINKVMFYLWNDVCKDLYSPNRISKQYFMRSEESEEKKDVFTFAELFGAGRYNEADQSYTKPVDLLEGFITKKLQLEPIPEKS